VARLAREADVERFIHVSGIGSDAGSSSPYIRTRGEGERVVREAFSATTLMRPSVMFGRGDAFVTPVARMLRRLPVFPLFGHAATSPCRERRRSDRQGDADQSGEDRHVPPYPSPASAFRSLEAVHWDGMAQRWPAALAGVTKNHRSGGRVSRSYTPSAKRATVNDIR
jgi:hypothetical protein